MYIIMGIINPSQPDAHAQIQSCGYDRNGDFVPC